MGKIINMIGQKYAKLTVLSQVGVNKSGEKMYECLCECGNIKVIRGNSIRRGLTTSCGCYRSQYISNKNKSHEQCDNPTYKSWTAMKSRCLNPNTVAYQNYGGRGIKICDEWMDFNNFLRDMGDKPKGKTLDRIDVNGNYEPSNCRWASVKEQNRNTRQNVMITYNGETLCMKEWAERLSISYPTLQSRIRSGWDAKKALET